MGCKAKWKYMDEYQCVGTKFSAITTTLYAEEQASPEAAVEENSGHTAAANSKLLHISSTASGAADTEANQAATALQKRNAMQLRKQTYRKYLLQMNIQYSLIKKGIFLMYDWLYLLSR